MYVNGSATYTSNPSSPITSLSSLTITPGLSSPWTVNVYAYNATYGLLASGYTISDIIPFTTVVSQTYTSQQVLAFSTTDWGNGGNIAVDMFQTKMLIGTQMGLWYATSSNSGLSWTTPIKIYNSSGSSSNAGACVALSSNGKIGAFYGKQPSSGNSVVYSVDWRSAIPTITSVSTSVAFYWSSLSMTPNGSVAVMGGTGGGTAPVYYMTWNATSFVFNTPIQFTYNSVGLVTYHIGVAISQDGTTLLEGKDNSATSNICYIKIVWSATTPPVPTLQSNWTALLGGGIDNWGYCFVGGNSTTASSYVVGCVGNSLSLFKYNTNNTLTSINTSLYSGSGSSFGLAVCGVNGNVFYVCTGSGATISRVILSVA